MSNDTNFKYKITTRKIIGKGSFSTVYHAIDKDNNIYAIKCISLNNPSFNKHNIDKFLLELDISIKMNHPNIVKSYEVFKTNKNWYIVSEFCDNGTLQNVIKLIHSKNSNYNNYFDKENICKRYMTQLKNALKYLHKNDIIHRDLKPNNILIHNNYPDDILKLADFGFARYFNTENEMEENIMTSFCGTPLYMAPELLIDKQYTSKSDLWSFGIIMYEMLYGYNPYNYPKNMYNLIELMKSQKISFCNNYSETCISLLKSLLQINPDDRISWEKFFKHEWFDKKIPTYLSKESFDSETSMSSHNSPNYATNLYKFQGEFKISYEELSNKFNEDDCNFDIIDKNEIKPCCYNSYNEKEEYGILKIVSNSVYNFFSKKT